MRPFSSYSIKKKLVAIIASSVVMAILLASCVLVLLDSKATEKAMINRIEELAHIVGENIVSALEKNDKQSGAEILYSLSIEPAIESVVIRNLNDVEFASFRRQLVMRHKHLIADNIDKSIFDELFNILVPVTKNGVQVGSIVVTANKRELHIHLVERTIIVALICVVAGLLGYLVSIHLQNYIYQPVKHMVLTTKYIQGCKDYSARVRKFYDDELGILTDNFNLMLDQIQQRDDELERQVSERTSELQKKNDKLADEMKGRIQAQSSLYESEKKFRSTFSNAAIGMLLVDCHDEIFQVNQAVCNMLGYQEGEFKNKIFSKIIYEEDRGTDEADMTMLVQGGLDHFSVKRRYLCKDGSAMWGLSTVSGVYDKNGDFIYAIYQLLDITEEYRLSQELSYQASHDVLTGLINRCEFENRINHAWEVVQDRKVCHLLCFVDLDQFKVINDTCGHIAGDEMLRQVAALLTENLRAQDSVARLGGDEFGILMEYCELNDGVAVIEDVRKSIEKIQFVWDDNRFKVTASIGVTLIDNESGSVLEMLKQADTACYAAKEAGRNQTSIYSSNDELFEKKIGEMKWVNRIQEAIEDDRLRLITQAIVPTVDQEAGIHFEVLVRLITEENEEVSPGAFLPAAERYGLASKIDEWVVGNVFEWMHDNSTFVANNVDMIAINLSGLTMSNHLFLDTVIDTIDSKAIPADKVCFEITETALIANLTNATNFIRALRRLGCKFALDDFGSGLSSFAYLKNLQVDFLKIDGMFVRDMLKNPVDHALVRSINEMGKVMGKKTIAEFVETKELFDSVKELGIDYAQGYGVGEIIPLLDLVGHLNIVEHYAQKPTLQLVK